MCVCVQDKLLYLRSEGLRESSMWYPDVSLQELHHRQGEGQLVRPLLYFCPGQVVLHHELGQVTHDLRGWSHLRDKGSVSTKLLCYCLYVKSPISFRRKKEEEDEEKSQH